MTNKLNIALGQLPEYIKLTYTNHALNKADMRNVPNLPDKVVKSDIKINKVWLKDNTLIKVRFQVEIGLNNLCLEIIYLPMAKHVKTVYLTSKKR